MKKKIKNDDKTLIEIYLRVAQKFAQNDKVEKTLETLKTMYSVLENSKKDRTLNLKRNQVLFKI